MDGFQPSYLKLIASGELEHRVRTAYRRLSSCDLCAQTCHVDRLQDEFGACQTGHLARVSSFGPHLGEEDPLRGAQGSGTIFFARCNLSCQYCQNYQISQRSSGHETQPEELAAIMLELQAQGCHNINFVSPSHIVPQLLAGLLIAAYGGLTLPLVYNTGGYDSLVTLQLLDNVIDIYMPDMKYADPVIGLKYSGIPDYPAVNQAAVQEMHRQVGDLETDRLGIAQRGLLVRHLVLPGKLAGTDRIVHFLAEEISSNTYLNLMDQYRPEYHAHQLPGLNRRISPPEYHQAVRWAKGAGLTRLDQRG